MTSMTCCAMIRACLPCRPLLFTLRHQWIFYTPQQEHRISRKQERPTNSKNKKKCVVNAMETCTLTFDPRTFSWFHDKEKATRKCCSNVIKFHAIMSWMWLEDFLHVCNLSVKNKQCLWNLLLALFLGLLVMLLEFIMSVLFLLCVNPIFKAVAVYWLQ